MDTRIIGMVNNIRIAITLLNTVIIRQATELTLCVLPFPGCGCNSKSGFPILLFSFFIFRLVLTFFFSHC